MRGLEPVGARLPILHQITANRYDSDALVAAFLDAVLLFEGTYLCLDADSVLDLDADESVPLAESLLQALETTPPDTVLIFGNAKQLASVLSDEGYKTPGDVMFHQNLVGAWYALYPECRGDASRR